MVPKSRQRRDMSIKPGASRARTVFRLCNGHGKGFGQRKSTAPIWEWERVSKKGFGSSVEASFFVADDREKGTVVVRGAKNELLS